MSIFSSIKKSRQSAKSHNAKIAEQKKAEETAKPYRHVPTHAASDAIASAPPSWREADKVRIVEQNRRRSAMAASGHHMNMPGYPRVGSSLSYVAYPSDGTSSPQVPPLPRAYSHTGVPNFQGQAMYGVPQMAYSQPFSLKGKEVTRWPIYETPDQDPGYGKDAQSVAESSTESSSSRDNLEMRSAKANMHTIGMAETRSHPSPTRSRRKSDPLTDDFNMNRNSHTNGSPRDPRPPPSTRGFKAIPPSAIPPLVMGAALPGPLSPVAPPTSSPTQYQVKSGLGTAPVSPTSNGALAVQTPPLKASRDSSAASLPGLTPTSSRVPASVPGTPGKGITSSFEFPFPAATTPTLDLKSTFSPSDHVGAVQPPHTLSSSHKQKDRRASQPPRFTELDRIDSAHEVPRHSEARMSPLDAPAQSSHGQVVNMFPEAVVPATEAADDGKKTKGKKPRKSGNKLVKKPRVASSAGGK